MEGTITNTFSFLTCLKVKNISPSLRSVSPGLAGSLFSLASSAMELIKGEKVARKNGIGLSCASTGSVLKEVFEERC